MTERILLNIDAGVAEVRLNRPEKMNAIDPAMFEALVTIGERLMNEADLRAVVLSGKGRAFCAGLDMASMVSLASEGKTILISSHQIAEVERVASHVAFLAGGRLLWSGTLDELRQRIIRVKLRYESQPPEPATLGIVLQRNGTGKLLQAIIQDPNRDAVAALRQTEGISEVEECTLGLEEVYAALLGQSEVRP